MSKTLITKVKFSGNPANGIEIHFTRMIEDKKDQLTLKSNDAPDPELGHLWRTMFQHLISEMGLDEEKHALSISNVDFGYPSMNLPEQYTAVFSGEINVENAMEPFTFKSPKKGAHIFPRDGESEEDFQKKNLNDEKGHFSHNFTILLNNLLEQCRLYIEGKRAQTDLFDQELYEEAA